MSCLIELLDAILDSPLQHPEGVMARPTGILYETPNPAFFYPPLLFRRIKRSGFSVVSTAFSLQALKENATCR